MPKLCQRTDHPERKKNLYIYLYIDFIYIYIYLYFHLKAAEYTFFSSAHRTFSGIDSHAKS